MKMETSWRIWWEQNLADELCIGLEGESVNHSALINGGERAGRIENNSDNSYFHGMGPTSGMVRMTLERGFAMIFIRLKGRSRIDGMCSLYNSVRIGCKKNSILLMNNDLQDALHKYIGKKLTQASAALLFSWLMKYYRLTQTSRMDAMTVGLERSYNRNARNSWLPAWLIVGVKDRDETINNFHMRHGWLTGSARFLVLLVLIGNFFQSTFPTVVSTQSIRYVRRWYEMEACESLVLESNVNIKLLFKNKIC